MARQSPVVSFLAFPPQAALLAVARVLPYRARLALGAGVARLLVAVVPELRARIDKNLRLIYPDMTALERRRIRRAVADNFGRTFIELMTSEAFEPARPGPTLAAPAGRRSSAALRDGRGVLLVSGHFGQWEAVRGMLKARGIEAGALYRPFKNPWLERGYLGHLQDMGWPIFNRYRSGLRDLVRHLEVGRRGVRAARPAHQARPAGRLPRPAGAERHDDRRAGAEVPRADDPGLRHPPARTGAPGHRLRAAARPTTAEAMTQAAADSLAARVAARPEQYYWLHQRWIKWFVGS